ncbi:MAG: serine--tRNA ligase [Rickettsiaceae bacterium]|nr:serine--tRNA ligase [Rickettsiaceae bacterium]
MLDIKWIRENSAEFDRLMSLRGLEPSSEKLISLDEAKRQTTTSIQQLQQVRNEKSKKLSEFRDPSNPEFQKIKKESEDIKSQIEALEKSLEGDNELQDLLDRLPNLPLSDVPFGEDESENVILRKWGEIKEFTNPKQHFDIGEELEMMDFGLAAKMSGSRFVVLKSDLARLERAIASFMLDLHTTEFGFTEVSAPYLVKDEAMYYAGQLPKFADDSFQTTNNYRLIPTSEVSLVNLVSNTIIPRELLPLRYTAYTPCFRSEAGAAGRDTRGMIRLHQFSKVELVSITPEDESEHEHERITQAAETVLKKLELPYRVMVLCTGDMGFASKKTYDLEVWLPGQKKYREISSCSNCGDFQARRLKARYKDFGQTNTKFAHTLNGSGLAVGRTLVAILENYQNEDGSVTIPDVLKNYMGGQKIIEKVS